MITEKVHHYNITLTSPNETIEAEIGLYMSNGNYVLSIPGIIAGTLCIEDPARFKQILNNMIDEMIEVENSAYEKNSENLEKVIEISAQG